MRIIEDVKLDFNDVLIIPQRATHDTEIKSREEISLERTFSFPYSKNSWTGVPIIASNMDTVGTFGAAEILSKYKMLTSIHKFYGSADWEEAVKSTWYSPEYVIPTFGIKDTDYDKLLGVHAIHKANSKLQKWVCIDVPNGYTQPFIDFIIKVRSQYPDLRIIAGNVCTPNMAEQVIQAGADIVKVGIGGGQQCRTRVVTGIGYPQLSSNMECADAVKGLGGWIISDGGCSNSGDVAKALASSDGFVMLGSMLAAHQENTDKENLVENYSGEYVDSISVKVYGMSSNTAMEKHYGGKATYKASEGATSLIEYRGKIEDTINEILGGLRSTLTYVGATRLKHLNKRATFIKVNRTHNDAYAHLKIGN